jgi:hypothetical protein
MWEHWCEFRATLDASRPAEPVTISSEQAAAAAAAAAGSKPGKTGSSRSSGSASSKDAAAAVCGKRYRLAAMEMDSTRALPTKGKVCRFAGYNCCSRLLVLRVCKLGTSCRVCCMSLRSWQELAMHYRPPTCSNMGSRSLSAYSMCSELNCQQAKDVASG